MRRRCTEAGFTLLEALLAVFILAGASALVAVNLPPPEPALAHEARTFAARLTVASEEAVVSGRPVGVVIDEAGYGFRRRVAGEWRPIADDPTLAPRAWPADAEVEISRDGARLDRARLAGLERGGEARETRTPAPSLRFDPEGAASGLTLTLHDAEGGYTVAVDAAGAVSLLADGEG